MQFYPIVPEYFVVVTDMLEEKQMPALTEEHSVFSPGVSKEKEMSPKRRSWTPPTSLLRVFSFAYRHHANILDINVADCS